MFIDSDWHGKVIATPLINFHFTILFCSSQLFIMAVKHALCEAVIIVLWKLHKAHRKREKTIKVLLMFTRSRCFQLQHTKACNEMRNNFSSFERLFAKTFQWKTHFSSSFFNYSCSKVESH